MYAYFGKTNIWTNAFTYYMNGNGRLWINLLDSALLRFDRYLYILFNPWIIMLFLTLLAKNVQWITRANANQVSTIKLVRYGIVLFSSLNVLCLRETVFWITGMMNYLFPATIFLYALLLFQRNVENDDDNIIHRIIYYIVCLFASSSVEQFALMFVGFQTFALALKLVRKAKISRITIVGYIFSLLALGFLILAPGNFQRVGDQSAIKPSFVDNFWTLVYQDTLATVPIPFLIMLSICGQSILRRIKQPKWLKVLCWVLPIFLLLYRCVPQINKVVIAIPLIILFVIEMTFLFIFRKYNEKETTVFLIVIGIGSQLMLLISAIWGYRCMFSLYLIYMLLILLCLTKQSRYERGIVLCSGIVSNIFPPALVLVWLIQYILKDKEKENTVITKVIIYSSVLVSMIAIFIGYGTNIKVHLKNLENTNHVKNGGSIILEELPDELFSWYFIPIDEFHEKYYRLYNEIPENVEIVYREKLDLN